MEDRSILFVDDGEEPTHRCFGRALMLARYLDARLDVLFWNQSSAAFSGRSAGILEREWQYLNALRNRVAAPDVEIALETTLAASLPEAIKSRSGSKGLMLVVKRACRGHAARRSRSDWELMHDCAVPLLLTEGNTWHPRARFAAAIDPMDQRPGSADRCRAVVAVASSLRLACAADLDLIYAQPAGAAGTAPEGESPAQLRLSELAEDFELDTQRLHLLSGNPRHVLSQFVAARAFDLLLIGAPAQGAPVSDPGSPLARSLANLDLDLLTVPDGAPREGSMLAGHRGFRWDSAPLWQWLGTD